jgi:hypothetical protein
MCRFAQVGWRQYTVDDRRFPSIDAGRIMDQMNRVERLSSERVPESPTA